MSRVIPCDMGHDDPVEFAYMITDGATGDVIALCGHCVIDFAAGMCRAAGWQVIPPDTPSELAEAGPEPPPAVKRAARKASEPAQRARTRRQLAARPDSAATSAAVVDFPGGDHA